MHDNRLSERALLAALIAVLVLFGLTVTVTDSADGQTLGPCTPEVLEGWTPADGQVCCAEDDPCFDCATMGNRICGPGPHDQPRAGRGHPGGDGLMWNNPVCEDAPCCGCCGAAVMAAEARADEEWANDPDRFDDDDWFEED